MTSVKYGRALDLLFEGRHRDKRIANAFGVSVRMAKYLRSGEHWTLRHLERAAELFGDAWAAALDAPSSPYISHLNMADLESRVARLEQALDEEMARRRSQELARAASTPSGDSGGRYSSDAFEKSGGVR